jgi:acyl-CoA thioesterase-1
MKHLRILTLAGFLFSTALIAPVVHAETALILGDSLSAEYGLVRGTGWVPLLQKRLQADATGVDVVNASISGETTSGGRARVQALLDKYRPGVVVIELGGNDALRGLALDATDQNLRDIIQAAQKARAKVVILGMQIPPNYGPDYTDRFAGLFPKLAKETKSVLVPFFLDKVVEKPDLFQADRIHPTAQAQPLMLASVWPYLKPLLEKAKR